jgi:hypothetical protein
MRDTGIGQAELIDALRSLASSCGHEACGPNRCAFNTKGCTCGKTEELRVALANANQILRELDTQRTLLREFLKRKEDTQ